MADQQINSVGKKNRIKYLNIASINFLETSPH